MELEYEDRTGDGSLLPHRVWLLDAERRELVAGFALKEHAVEYAFLAGYALEQRSK